MVTGLECCGLVLAVIPILIEAAKVYGRGVKSIQDVVQPGRFDMASDEFYDELFCQMFEFQERIRYVIDCLPDLDDARKADIVEKFAEDDWRSDSDGALAFSARLKNQHEFQMFETIVKKVVKEMGQLIEDRVVYVSKASAVSTILLCTS